MANEYEMPREVKEEASSTGSTQTPVIICLSIIRSEPHSEFRIYGQTDLVELCNFCLGDAGYEYSRGFRAQIYRLNIIQYSLQEPTGQAQPDLSDYSDLMNGDTNSDVSGRSQNFFLSNHVGSLVVEIHIWGCAGGLHLTRLHPTGCAAGCASQSHFIVVPMITPRQFAVTLHDSNEDIL